MSLHLENLVLQDNRALSVTTIFTRCVLSGYIREVLHQIREVVNNLPRIDD